MQILDRVFTLTRSQTMFVSALFLYYVFSLVFNGITLLLCSVVFMLTSKNSMSDLEPKLCGHGNYELNNIFMLLKVAIIVFVDRKALTLCHGFSVLGI